MNILSRDLRVITGMLNVSGIRIKQYAGGDGDNGEPDDDPNEPVAPPRPPSLK